MAPSELPVSRKDCFLETPHLAPSADIPLNLTHSDVLSKKASSSPALEVIYEHSQDQKSIFRLEQHQYESSAVVMPMSKATRKCHSKKWQSQHCPRDSRPPSGSYTCYVETLDTVKSCSCFSSL